MGRPHLQNPPYECKIDLWIRKFLSSFVAGDISEGIALVPARTDTAWFRRFEHAPVCFVRGRLKFSNVANSAPFPSALFYLGPKPARFANIFAELGRIYLPHSGERDSAPSRNLEGGAMRHMTP